MAETTKSADRSIKFWQLGGIFLVSIAFSVAASVLHFLANPIAGSYSVSYKLTHIPLRGVSVKLVRLDLERLFSRKKFSMNGRREITLSHLS